MDKAFQQLFLIGNVSVRQYYVAHRPLVVNACTKENNLLQFHDISIKNKNIFLKLFATFSNTEKTHMTIKQN